MHESELDLEGRCSYCSEVVDQGELSWQLVSIDTLSRHPQTPLDTKLGPGGTEPGLGRPTPVQPDLAAALRAMTRRNPDFDPARFREHVRHVFHSLQKAWSEMRWEEARPFETDRLFQSHRFWIERYRAQGLRNKLDDITIDRLVVARVERDAWFEIITVRIYASMLDCVVDGDGKVVGGNPRVHRKFSEYWTFVKRSGVRVDPDRSVTNCPSCGAAADRVNQAGICGYCDAKITTGEFDWVLALIEQDDVFE